MKTKLNFIFAIILSAFCFSCQNGQNNSETNIDFTKGSTITNIKLNAQKIEDIALLGKVWGFLKYYHPIVAKGSFNWDFELFKVLPKIIDCKTKDERNLILSNWIENLGPVVEGSEKKYDSSKVKCYPDLDWIKTTSLIGNKLSEDLIKIKKAKRSGENHYVKLAYGGENPVFTNEDSCKQFLFPDLGYRLLCLFRYWNCIEYYYPNKNLIGQDWNNVLFEFIPKFANDSNELEYELTVSDLIVCIHDTHGIMLCHNKGWENHWGKYLSVAKIAFIENKAIVIDYYDEKLGANSELEKGDIILKIGNQSVEDFVKEDLPHTQGSNYPTALRNIAYNLLSSTDSFLNITYQHNSDVHSIKVKCYDEKKIRNGIVKYKVQDTCFKYLTPTVAYFYPGNFKNKYLSKVFPESLKSKGLIIDFRCYPSDQILSSFVNYFFETPTPYLKTSRANIMMPGLFTFSHTFLVGTTNSNYYKGKVVILVNERTQSQAEWDVMSLRTMKNVTVIGSTTAGADGNVSEINLIGGIKTLISGRGVYYPDGRETQRVGIVPDIEVHPTIKGIRAGRDELVEKAIEIINK